MLMPSIFNDNLFDDFFDFPFYDDKADRKIQRKLYGGQTPGTRFRKS